MALIQAITIGLVALIIAPCYFFYYDITPKLVVLLAGTAACGLAAGFERNGKPPARLFTWLLLATAAWLLVASALSGNPALSFFGSTWRRFGAVAQLAVLLLAWLIAQNGERARAMVLRGAVAACAIAATYGIGQYFGWDPLLPKSSYHIGEGMWTIVRPPGTMGYVSYFSTLLLMGGFLSLAVANAEAVRSRRMLAYCSAGLCFAAMALTGTRAALLGLAAGVAVAGYVRGFRISRRMAVTAALAAIAGAGFYVSPLGSGLRSRARWFREDPWGGARPLLWRDSLRMGIARPVAGFGAEVFIGTFPLFESKELARAYPDFAHESPHNIFLDALVSQGLPGLACLIALCGMGLAAAWQGKQPWLGAALAGGIVAQQFTVFTIPTALVFYAVIALCMGAPCMGPSRQIDCPTSIFRWPRRFAGALFAAAMLYLAVRYGAADRALELASRQVAMGDAAKAQAYYREYQQNRLPGASADLWYARSLLVLSQKGDPLQRLQLLRTAVAVSLRAIQNAEDPFDAWYNLAEVSATANDAADTESSLRRAIGANPNWFKPHWTLARLLRAEGRASEAAAEAALAADLDGGKHPEVAQTLAEILALHR